MERDRQTDRQRQRETDWGLGNYEGDRKPPKLVDTDRQTDRGNGIKNSPWRM